MLVRVRRYYQGPDQGRTQDIFRGAVRGKTMTIPFISPIYKCVLCD